MAQSVVVFMVTVPEDRRDFVIEAMANWCDDYGWPLAMPESGPPTCSECGHLMVYDGTLDAHVCRNHTEDD